MLYDQEPSWKLLAEPGLAWVGRGFQEVHDHKPFAIVPDWDWITQLLRWALKPTRFFLSNALLKASFLSFN
jgi:hypothetical protein